MRAFCTRSAIMVIAHVLASAIASCDGYGVRLCWSLATLLELTLRAARKHRLECDQHIV